MTNFIRGKEKREHRKTKNSNKRIRVQAKTKQTNRERKNNVVEGNDKKRTRCR